MFGLHTAGLLLAAAAVVLATPTEAGTSAALPGENQACKNGRCAEGFQCLQYCAPGPGWNCSMRCKKIKPKVGDACSATKPCGDFQFCDPDLHTCQARKHLDKPCSKVGECYLSNCIEGKCRRRDGTRGSECEEDKDCKDKAFVPRRRVARQRDPPRVSVPRAWRAGRRAQVRGHKRLLRTGQQLQGECVRRGQLLQVRV